MLLMSQIACFSPPHVRSVNKDAICQSEKSHLFLGFVRMRSGDVTLNLNALPILWFEVVDSFSTDALVSAMHQIDGNVPDVLKSNLMGLKSQYVHYCNILLG